MMPISGPGTSSRQASQGFTLVEMLVVLLIMGLLAGLVGTLARPDDRAVLRLEAERLAQLLELAMSESRFSGSSVAWTADGAGYRFLRQGAEAESAAQWAEIPGNDLLRARALPQGVRVSTLRVDGIATRGDLRLAFPPYGPLTPFSLELSLGAERYGIAASPVGELRVAPVTGGSNAEPASR